jgi:SAM-dependent methyltransferase
MHPEYDPDIYDQHRPRYPKELYDKIMEFHRLHPNAGFECAVDLGSGTGVTAQSLTESFERVIAIDSNPQMLAQIKNPKIETQTAVAEEFSAQNVDLITISTAAHWMDMEIVYPKALEALKQSGTLAIWAYGHCTFPQYKELTTLFLEYSMDFLGPFWDPRRGRLDRMYSDPDFVMTPFPVYDRQLYPDDDNGPLMTFQWTWEQLASYLRTWSPYKVFKEKHPDQPDCVDVFVAAGKQIANVAVLDVVFPIVLILCKKEIALSKPWKCTLKAAPSE